MATHRASRRRVGVIAVSFAEGEMRDNESAPEGDDDAEDADDHDGRVARV
jgi:hypothetical protein